MVKPIHGSLGFTYLVVLVVIVLTGLSAAAMGTAWKAQSQRMREAELLYLGDQYRRAIALYYERSPGGAKRYPKDLLLLLKDDRYPTPQRYLRKLFPDPMSHGADWQLVIAPDGGIMGIRSSSNDQPVRKHALPAYLIGASDAKTYADWAFVYVPSADTSAPSLGTNR